MTWINFFVSIASFGGFGTVGLAPSIIVSLPTLIVCLVTGIRWCHVLNNEHTDKDYETRRIFYRTYFIWQVIVMTLVYVIGFFVMVNWMSNHCSEMMPGLNHEDCDSVADAFAFRLAFNELVTIALNVYYSYVLKLFAEQIQPDRDGIAARHY